MKLLKIIIKKKKKKKINIKRKRCSLTNKLLKNNNKFNK